MIPGGVNPMLLSSGASSYQIQRSLRLRRAASALLEKSYVAGSGLNDTSQVKKTYSFCAKRGALGLFSHIITNSISSVNRWQINFTANNELGIYGMEGGAVVCDMKTTALLRDPSAHYHIVIAADSSQATASDRLKIWINSIQQTLTGTTPTLNSITSGLMLRPTAGTWTARIGGEAVNGLGVNQLDAYLSELTVIDGQALTPTAFGQFDANGMWQPKAYAGTYGNNGFRLRFDDPTNLTTLCADSSGNGNNWTASNISLTAGINYDSMLDVPLGGGGNERGNYATLNPLNQLPLGGGGAVLTEGNLRNTNGDGGLSSGGFYVSTLGMQSGKFYCEMASVSTGTANLNLGLVPSKATGSYPATTSLLLAVYGAVAQNSIALNGSTVQSNLGFATNTDVYGLAFDADARTAQFYRNGVAHGAQVTGLTADEYCFALYASKDGGGVVSSGVMNFGQRPFTYTPPVGFKALHTGNLPSPTIANGRNHFDTYLYTGDTTNNRTLTVAQFDPDLAWFKARGAGWNNALIDRVRGNDKVLISNTTSAEPAFTGYASFGATGSKQITVSYIGSAGATNEFNTNTSYVSWLWKAGGTPVTNNNGSISAQVSANPAAGFSIVTYTGNGTAGATIGHGLGVAPKMVITKSRTGVVSWVVGHSGLGASPWNNLVSLNLTNASAAASTVWNNTAPSASVVTLGTDQGVNASTAPYVAYCFAEIAGFSKFGSYTGNASVDGPFVYCGFRPRFVMVKRVDNTGDWFIVDAVRNTSNAANNYLVPNSPNGEPSTISIDFLANGFKIRVDGSSWPAVNPSGGTVIYAAFAEAPFKNALAR